TRCADRSNFQKVASCGAFFHFHLLSIGNFRSSVPQIVIQASSSTAVHNVCTKRVALLLEKVPRGPIFLLRRAAQAFDNTRSLIQTVYRYSREDLARILQVSPRQLLAWEKAGLLTRAETYNFFDLLQVKKVRDLCARHVRPIEIRQSLVA